MGLKEWLGHPWRCMSAIAFAVKYAVVTRMMDGARLTVEFTDLGRQATLNVQRHHVIPGSAGLGRPANGRHRRLEGQRASSWPDRYVPDSRQLDDTLDFPGPA